MKQFYAYLLIFGLIATTFSIGMFSSNGFNFGKLNPADNQTNLGVKQVFAAGSKEAFDYLSTTKTTTSSFCGLQPTTVDGFSDEDNIQGACCGAMDFHRYQEQVEGLKQYKDISQIPEDPYNIPVTLAKQLFEYQQTITLSEEQQAIYDQAMEMSHEGGPCCCKCWRWTAFEGQAKFLITEYGWSAQEIADLWDIQDGCGGPGHVGEEGGHGH
jgi:hypothetical protein